MEKGNENRVFISENLQSKTINTDLGIIENEVFTGNKNEAIELIVFNRLEMILALNEKLLAN